MAIDWGDSEFDLVFDRAKKPAMLVVHLLEGLKMGLTKGFLLGTGAAVVSVAAAQAADLPVRKAAPVEYVRICDAYGAGFFFIPGTETCLRIGGRVRADYAFVPEQDIYVGATRLPFATRPGVQTSAVLGNFTPPAGGVSLGRPGTRFNPSSASDVYSGALNTTGWEARARIEFDARTNTSWGTVRTVAALRLSRTTGVLAGTAGVTGGGAGSTLETAYVQFAGFTFGAARDNFAYMPSRLYGAGHWGSFANGAKQLAYTLTLGGGLSATVALQDPIDTTVGGYDYTWYRSSITGSGFESFGSLRPSEPSRLPQLNANLQWQQGWGDLFLAGAVRRITAASSEFVTITDSSASTVVPFDADATGWAIGAGMKFNLPMLANGSAIWFTAAYADGMTEYTTNWSSFKSSAYRRDVGGLQINHPSYVMVGNNYANVGKVTSDIQTVKSWNVAALMDHFWTPQWRSTLMASYGQIQAPSAAKACVIGLTGENPISTSGSNTPNIGLSTAANGCFGDATVWNVATQLAWLPTRNFEIGIEVLYARTSFDMPAGGSGIENVTLGCLNRNFDVGGAKCSEGNFTGRLRVERTF